MNVLNRLKIAIKKSDSNQKKIAKHFGWPEATVGRITRGEVDPGVSKIEKIAKYLNINFTWLFTGRGPMFYPEYKNEYGMVSDHHQQYEPFNRSTDEFTELALEIIRDEQITQDELVAAVREVRRRRRPGAAEYLLDAAPAQGPDDELK